jgi:hypothetical protein
MRKPHGISGVVYSGSLISRTKNKAIRGHMIKVIGAIKEKRATIAISGYHFSETGAGTAFCDLGNSDIWGKHVDQLCADT